MNCSLLWVKKETSVRRNGSSKRKQAHCWVLCYEGEELACYARVRRPPGRSSKRSSKVLFCWAGCVSRANVVTIFLTRHPQAQRGDTRHTEHELTSESVSGKT